MQIQPLAKKTVVGTSVKFTASTFAPGLIDGDGKCVHCSQSVHVAGPIYSAPIHKMQFVNSLIERLALVFGAFFNVVLHNTQFSLRDFGPILKFFEVFFNPKLEIKLGLWSRKRITQDLTLTFTTVPVASVKHM